MRFVLNQQAQDELKKIIGGGSGEIPFGQQNGKFYRGQAVKKFKIDFGKFFTWLENYKAGNSLDYAGFNILTGDWYSSSGQYNIRLFSVNCLDSRKDIELHISSDLSITATKEGQLYAAKGYNSIYELQDDYTSIRDFLVNGIGTYEFEFQDYVLEQCPIIIECIHPEDEFYRNYNWTKDDMNIFDTVDFIEVL